MNVVDDLREYRDMNRSVFNKRTIESILRRH